MSDDEVEGMQKDSSSTICDSIIGRGMVTDALAKIDFELINEMEVEERLCHSSIASQTDFGLFLNLI